MNTGLLANLINQSEQFMRRKVAACKDGHDINLLNELDITGEKLRYSLVAVPLLGVLVGDVDKFAKMPKRLKEGARVKAIEIISTMGKISDQIDSLEGVVDIEKVNAANLSFNTNIIKLKSECNSLIDTFSYGKNKASDMDCSF
jgi:hypothetical protein